MDLFFCIRNCCRLPLCRRGGPFSEIISNAGEADACEEMQFVRTARAAAPPQRRPAIHIRSFTRSPQAATRIQNACPPPSANNRPHLENTRVIPHFTVLRNGEMIGISTESIPFEISILTRHCCIFGPRSAGTAYERKVSCGPPRAEAAARATLRVAKYSASFHIFLLSKRKMNGIATDQFLV